MSKEAGFDQALTVFSPEGRLYQIEYAFEAVQQSRLCGVALRCSDGIIFISQLPTFDRLQDSSRTSFVHKVNQNCSCLVAGRTADGRRLVDRLRSEAQDFYSQFGYQPTADIAAERIADVIQVVTQEASLRPYGNVLFIGGWDNENNKPLLYRVDPAGACVGIRGYAVGFKGTEMNDYLVGKKGEFGNCEQGVKVGLSLFQKYVSQSLIGDDVEVWVGKEAGFAKVNAKDVDDILEGLKIE
ncbi:20S_proteasome alpha subunit 1 [Hexamita inflata]|uniref:Proteasome subunit alpha type n=1 Tax=Hexamita inflata TaxID=28002 RepID=A0AA86NU66_9EUKA|nr:20S proteasome alpha subunit 1 [Hexamita inflata]CAI9954159.1 20S proteasome alpha subunit 1 [Hexamita inflata]CAI9963255.1 20S proteasome alpha subunit 1 [Hexamita inflata]